MMVATQDLIVTMFGGDGFVGRYAAPALYRAGARLRIAGRNPRSAWFLQTQGGVGQTQFVRTDIRDPAQVAAAVCGSNAVVNLVGVLNGDFEAIHVGGARNIAEAAAAAGARAFVQVSAIGADLESASAYGHSKGEGEAAVRAAFPGATILRPSVIFGQEDDFTNRFARMAKWLPALPVIRGATRFQPVWVGDVGRAIAAALADPRQHGGKTFEIGGPQVLTMRELNQWVAREIGRSRAMIDVPDAIAAAMARFGGWAPGAPITWDQWLMLQQDNVVAEDVPSLAELGISPTPLAAVAEEWLTTYRRRGRFAQANSPY
jgi:NADH dehydrogenase